MKIDWTEKPNGLDLLELRDFMKRSVSGTEISISTLASIFRHEWRRMVRTENPRQGADLPALRQKVETECLLSLATLQKLGYIEIIQDPPFGIHYSRTIAGAAFAMASPKRFTRQAAQKQLDEFIRRCQELNAQVPSLDHPETICRVEAVVVFGSFATEGITDVGDVDLCLTLSVRDRDLYRQHNSRSFKRFAVSEALKRAPDFQALKKLRRGLNILSIGTELPEGVNGTTLLKWEEEAA
jgi:hypothetical protein